VVEEVAYRVLVGLPWFCDSGLRKVPGSDWSWVNFLLSLGGIANWAGLSCASPVYLLYWRRLPSVWLISHMGATWFL